MCPRLYLTSIILAGIRFGKSWKRKKEREQMNKSKDRCYVCLTVWPDLAIFTTLTKNSAFATKFGGSFSIWHIVEQTLANFVCYWANLDCCFCQLSGQHLSQWICSFEPCLCKKAESLNQIQFYKAYFKSGKWDFLNHYCFSSSWIHDHTTYYVSLPI